MKTTIEHELALHPLCTLFPRLTGAEFDALKADILANGQREPIVVHEGLVLDGGNRYQACVEAGVEPILKEFTGTDPVAYVLSANLHRRHLTPGQQAAIVARAQNWANAQSVGNPAFKAAAQSGNVAGLSTVADRAAQSGASERTQRMADKVAKESPELARQVAHGDISLPKALEQLAPKVEAVPKASTWPFPNPSPGSPAAIYNASLEEGADPLYDQAVAVVMKNRRASISLVQRELRIGYNRAARLIEQMEQRGLVSPMQPNGDRLIMAPLPLEQGDDEDDDDNAAEQDEADTTAHSIDDDGHEQLLADYNLVVARNVELLQRIAALTQDDLALQVDALALKCAQFDSLATTRFNEIAELKTVVERQRSFLDGLRRAAGLPKGGDLLTWIKHAAQRAA